MKMIDVYTKMTNFKIGLGTKLIIGDYTFCYVKRWFSELSVSYRFEDEKEKTLEDYYDIDLDFLKKEVELIPPQEKKYLIKVNVQWLDKDFAYLNYDKQKDCVMIYNKVENMPYKTHFTKQELQSIKPVREFLKDMKGKCELIEVEEDESMDS
jgi:hypothetical protein